MKGLFALATITLVSANTVPGELDASKIDVSKIKAVSNPAPASYSCTGKKDWALTFSSGPSNSTAKVLDILKQKNVKATFFVTGEQATAHSAVVKRVVQEGHQLGFSAYNDMKSMDTMNKNELVASVTYSMKAVVDAAGIVPKYVRPIFGSIDGDVLGVIESMGFKVVAWNKDTKSHRLFNEPKFADQIQSDVKAWAKENNDYGNIVLMQDLMDLQADQIPGIVRTTSEAGINLVPMSACLGDSSWTWNTASVNNSQLTVMSDIFKQVTGSSISMAALSPNAVANVVNGGAVGGANGTTNANGTANANGTTNGNKNNGTTVAKLPGNNANVFGFSATLLGLVGLLSML